MSEQSQQPKDAVHAARMEPEHPFRVRERGKAPIITISAKVPRTDGPVSVTAHVENYVQIVKRVRERLLALALKRLEYGEHDSKRTD